MSRRKLGFGLLLLYGGEIAGKLLAILAFGHLWRTLGETRYGDLEFALGLLFVADLVLDAGLAPYGSREASRRPGELPQLAARILRIRLIFLLITATGLGLASIMSPGDATARLLIATYVLVLMPAPFLLNWAFEARGEMSVVAGCSLLRQVVFIGGVFALVHEPDHVLRVPMIVATAFLLAVTVQQILLRKRVGRLGLLRPPGEIGRVLRESLPLTVSSLVWALRLFAPLLGLYLFVSPEETARFGAAHRLVLSLHALVWLYFVNLLPEMSRRADDPAALGRLLRGSALLIAGVVAIGLPTGVLLASPILALVYGAGTSASSEAFAILGGLIAAAFLSGHVRYGLIARREAGRELMASAAGGILSVASVLILRDRLDPVAAAVILVAAEVLTGIVALAAFLAGRRKSPRSA